MPYDVLMIKNEANNPTHWMLLPETPEEEWLR